MITLKGIKMIAKLMEYMFKGGIIIAVLFILLCMNVFTIPLFILCWLFCKLFRLRTPRFAGYGFMVYPTWDDSPHNGYLDDLQRMEREERKQDEARRRRTRPIRAWEERFF